MFKHPVCNALFVTVFSACFCAILMLVGANPMLIMPVVVLLSPATAHIFMASQSCVENKEIVSIFGEDEQIYTPIAITTSVLVPIGILIGLSEILVFGIASIVLGCVYALSQHIEELLFQHEAQATAKAESEVSQFTSLENKQKIEDIKTKLDTLLEEKPNTADATERKRA